MKAYIFKRIPWFCGPPGLQKLHKFRHRNLEVFEILGGVKKPRNPFANVCFHGFFWSFYDQFQQKKGPKPYRRKVWAARDASNSVPDFKKKPPNLTCVRFGPSSGLQNTSKTSKISKTSKVARPWTCDLSTWRDTEAPVRSLTGGTLTRLKWEDDALQAHYLSNRIVRLRKTKGQPSF